MRAAPAAGGTGASRIRTRSSRRARRVRRARFASASTSSIACSISPARSPPSAATCGSSPRTARDEKLLDTVRELDRLSFDLQEAIMNVRLVPVGPSLRHFHRVVRDLAASQGKRAMLVLEGEDVEVDTTVIEQLKDPITHMIRNAVDHGFESTDVRLARGKNAIGTIRITALHQSGGIVFRITDDGAGLNEAVIAERTRALGIDPERLSRQELWTHDAAARLLDRVRGQRHLRTRRGDGHRAAQRRIVARHAQHRLAARHRHDHRHPAAVDRRRHRRIRRRSLRRNLRHPHRHDRRMHGDDRRGARREVGVINLRGEPLPFVRLRSIFGFEADETPHAKTSSSSSTQHGRAGIVVDRLFGSSQVVMKPMGRFLRAGPGSGRLLNPRKRARGPDPRCPGNHPPRGRIRRGERHRATESF